MLSKSIISFTPVIVKGNSSIWGFYWLEMLIYLIIVSLLGFYSPSIHLFFPEI